MRVEVYRNLRNGLMSVREANGRVLDHAAVVYVGKPKFVVQPAGRAKVVKEQRKNVHAFVRGELLGFTVGTLKGFDDWQDWQQATYNPYRYNSFVNMHSRRAIFDADRAVVTTHGVYYV